MDAVDVYAYLCACSDMCGGTYMHVCALACRRPRLTPRGFLSCSGSYSLRLLLSKMINDKWSMIKWTELTSLLKGSPFSTFWNYGGHHVQLAFLWVLGIWDTQIMYLSKTAWVCCSKLNSVWSSTFMFSNEASASRVPEVEDELGTMYLETCILKF